MGNQPWGGKLWEGCCWEGCQETGIEVRGGCGLLCTPAGCFTLDWSVWWVSLLHPGGGMWEVEWQEGHGQGQLGNCWWFWFSDLYFQIILNLKKICMNSSTGFTS